MELEIALQINRIVTVANFTKQGWLVDIGTFSVFVAAKK